MAQNDTQLQIVIKAVDDASASFQKVSAEVAKLKGSLDQATTSAKTNSEAQKGLAGATESTATSVFKGVAAWDALKLAIRAAADFLRSSFSDYIDAQKQLDLTKATVESMGISFDKVKGQLSDFGKQMTQFGIDDEAAMLAAANLAKVAGNDLPRGFQLAKLAADLTASGYNDFAGNVDNLTRILSGKGQRALMDYKINMSDSATTAEQLAAVQAKVTQSSEQYANTASGKIAAVTEQWKNIKEEVGEGVAPVVLELFADFEKHLPEIESLVKGVVKTIEAMAQAMGYVVKAANELGSVLGSGLTTEQLDANDAMLQAKIHADSLAFAYNKLHAGAKVTGDAFLGQSIDMKLLRDATAAYKTVLGDTEVKTKSVKTTFDGVKNTNTTLNTSYKDLKDAIKNAGDEYDDLKSKAKSNLAELSDAHRTAMRSINDSISKTQEAMTRLTASYNQSQSDATKGIADSIIASETKVADLKKQINNETDEARLKDLQAQLAAEETNLASSADFQAGNADAIAEARRRAGETELQRLIEDYKSKQALAAADYAYQYAQLQQELKDQKLKKDEEVILYNDRVATISALLNAAQDEYKKMSEERLKVTTDEVNEEIKLFQKLAAAISQAKSASQSALSSVGIKVSGARADGGPVSSGSSYLVGERGPEIFTPVQSGVIIPDFKSGGYSIVINILGNTLMSERAAEEIGDTIIDRFKKVAKI